MTREQMMDNVIRAYGFEARETIAFCRLCERDVPIAKIEGVYTDLMMWKGLL